MLRGKVVLTISGRRADEFRHLGCFLDIAADTVPRLQP